MSNDKKIETLLDGYFDGELTLEEVERLEESIQSDADLKLRFKERLREELLFHEVLRSSAQKVVPFRKRKKRRPLRIIVPLAASLALVFGITSYLKKAGHEPINRPQLARVFMILEQAGDSFKVNNNGAIRTLHRDSLLYAGDLITIPPNAELVIRYVDDKTELTLQPDTQIRLDDTENGAKHIRLVKGGLIANVAKQSENKPMKVFMNESEITVLGTSFDLLYDQMAKLNVLTGVVKMTALATKQSVVVRKGYYTEEKAGVIRQPMRVRKRIVKSTEFRTINKAPTDSSYVHLNPSAGQFCYFEFDIDFPMEQAVRLVARFRVAEHEGRETKGSGKFQLFRVDPTSEQEFSISDLTSKKMISGGERNGKSGTDIRFKINPSELSQGKNAFVLVMEKGGTPVKFFPQEGLPPRLTVDYVGTGK